MKYVKLFENFSEEENRKLFRKMADAPNRITIEITESGKRFINKLFEEVLTKSQPDSYKKSQPNWRPSINLNIDDNVTLEKKYYPEISHKEVPRPIAHIKINQPLTDWEKRWTTLSSIFKLKSGGSTDMISMYAFYLPFVDKDEKGARINIKVGPSFDNLQDNLFYPEEPYDYFDKIEVGTISNNHYFKIISVE